MAKSKAADALVFGGVACGALVVMLSAVILSALINAFVFVQLWNWFVVTKFTALPSLSLAEAYGLALVVNWVFKQHKLPTPKKAVDPIDSSRKIYSIVDDTTGFSIGLSVVERFLLFPGIVLLVGKIVHTFFIVG